MTCNLIVLAYLPTFLGGFKPMKRILVIVPLVIAFLSSTSAQNIRPSRNYSFNGTISEEVLRNYLSRSIVMHHLSTTWAKFTSPPDNGQYNDDLRMLTNVGAKHILLTQALWWNNTASWDVPTELALAAKVERDLHARDSEMILNAAVWETIGPAANRVPIPDWTFDAFNLPRETRNFNYELMLYPDRRNAGPTDTLAIDVTKIESKMWYYFWSRSYIDRGYESIHFGLVNYTDRNDLPEHIHWFDLATRIRRYAAQNARRNLVLLSCQDYFTNTGNSYATGKLGVVNSSGDLLFDYHVNALRPKEITISPQDAILDFYQDTIFGRSAGGRTPSGWTTEHLPYVAWFDNCCAPSPGVPIGFPFVWGWEEISWYAHQQEAYRNDWLRYAWNWIRANDPAGYLAPTGEVFLADPTTEATWYHINNDWFIPGPNDPPVRRMGLKGSNQENTLKAIWNGTDSLSILNSGFERPLLSTGQSVQRPGNPSWTFAGTAGVTANHSSLMVNNPSAPEGTQVAYLTQTGSFTQAISLRRGEYYRLTFAAAQRLRVGILDRQVIRVSLDNTLLASFRPVGGSFTDYSVLFSVPSDDVYNITFAGANSVGDDTAFVDNIRLVSNSEEQVKPKLLIEENTTRILALDSVTFMRDPFPLFTIYNFSADQRTRVAVFAADMLTEDFSSVTAQAEDSQQRVYPLTVEFVGRVPDFGWLTQINLRLPDGLTGDAQISISARGRISNKALIRTRQ